MSSDETKTDLYELYFTGALTMAGAAFIVAAFLTPVDESVEFNSRALPLAMAIGIAVCGAVRLCSLYRLARGIDLLPIETRGVVVRVVVPLTAAMVAYVILVQALGYLAGTALILTAVQWIFGARRTILVLTLAITCAALAYYLFVSLLGMYMPDGWLVELVQEMWRAHAVS
jgi:hypothetical protein